MSQNLPEKPLPLSKWVGRRRQQLSARLFVLHERSRKVTTTLQLDGVAEEEATLAGTSELLKRLLSAEKHMRQMLVDHPAAVLVVDTQGQIQLVNNAVKDLFSMLGLSQSRIYMGSTADDLLPGVLTQGQIELQARSVECPAEQVSLIVKRTPVTWGKAEATLILLHDVTPQVEARRELEAAVSRLEQVNAMKSEFITMASHEFRTPLTSVLSSLDLMGEYLKRSERGLDDQLIERLHRHINRSREAVEHLDTMVEDMLILEKSHAGQFVSHSERINMNSLIEDVFRALEPKCEQHEVHLLQEGDRDTEPVLDARLMRHILTNLVNNAVQFSPSGSTVVVSVRQTDDVLQVEVRDQGMGIPAEDQANIFDIFYRGSNGAHSEGTGLGLAIVKRFVDMLNGKIELCSAPGEGTSVLMTFKSHTQQEQ